VEVQQVPEGLRQLNWILFVQQEWFDLAFKQLLFALDTDLDYWQHSARLLSGAREWEREGQERHLTLRGKELQAAGRWLRDGARKLPPPGPPVTDFIAASRTHQRRSRVLQSIVLVLFLLIAGTAAGLSLLLPPTPNQVITLSDAGPGSLREAIARSKPLDTITFAPHLAGALQLKTSLSIPKSLTIRGPGQGKLRVTALLPGFRFTVEQGSSVTLSDLLFTFPLVNQGGELTLINITISAPTSGVLTERKGGGILNEEGRLTLTNSIVAGNRAEHGGGIFNSGRLTLLNSLVLGNQADVGGGIFNDQSSTLVVINSTISGNTAHWSGGGIANEVGGMVILTNSSISGNRVVHALLAGPPEFEASGGGIFNDEGTLTLTSSTISDNTAKVGGGIFNFEGSLFLTNSTLSGNQGYGHLDLQNGVDLGGGGGALLNLGENQVPLDGIRPALMVIAFCTIYGNSAVAVNAGIKIDEARRRTCDHPLAHVGKMAYATEAGRSASERSFMR
jgi:hypothetical protein